MNVVRRCEGHTGTIYDVQATADFVLSAGDESVRVFDWETGIQVFRLQRVGAKAVRARCAFSTQDGSPILVIVGSGDKRVEHYELGVDASSSSHTRPSVSLSHRRHWRSSTPGTAIGLAFHNEFVVAGAEGPNSVVVLPLFRDGELDVREGASEDSASDNGVILCKQDGSYHIDVFGNTIVSGDRDRVVHVYTVGEPGVQRGFVKSATKS